MLGVFAMVYLLAGTTITTSGDLLCEETCDVYVNITSTYWEIKFSDDFNLIYFDKDVYYEVFVPTYGNKWRLFDYTKDSIKRKNKYNVLPNRFLIKVTKQKTETVKYGVKFMLEEEDPFLIGIKDCDTTFSFWNETSCSKKGIVPNGSLGCLENGLFLRNKSSCVRDGIIRVGNYNISSENRWCVIHPKDSRRIDCVSVSNGFHRANPFEFKECDKRGGQDCLIYFISDSGMSFNVSHVMSEKFVKGKTKSDFRSFK